MAYRAHACYRSTTSNILEKILTYIIFIMFILFGGPMIGAKMGGPRWSSGKLVPRASPNQTEHSYGFFFFFKPFNLSRSSSHISSPISAPHLSSSILWYLLQAAMEVGTSIADTSLSLSPPFLFLSPSPHFLSLIESLSVALSLSLSPSLSPAR